MIDTINRLRSHNSAAPLSVAVVTIAMERRFTRTAVQPHRSLDQRFQDQQSEGALDRIVFWPGNSQRAIPIASYRNHFASTNYMSMSKLDLFDAGRPL
jgi:hypothetical protein